MYTLVKSLIKLWAATLLVGLFWLVLFLHAYGRDLPDPRSLENISLPQTTTFLDRNGNLLYEMYDEERRTVVPLTSISPYVIKAVIAVEDKNFYTHQGVDLSAVARAAYTNSRNEDVYLNGGSTITQQLVKNTFLTREKTIARKIKEALLALKIDYIYTKEEILQMYLNEISFGNNAFGVEEAAKTYFNKSASDLTLSQSATLAAIPQRPTYFSPFGGNTDTLFERKNYILSRMKLLNLITQEEHDQAIAESPTKEHPDFHIRPSIYNAPHFVQYVKDQAVGLLDNIEDDKDLAQAGLVIKTTLDINEQNKAEESINRYLPLIKRYGASNAGMIALMPDTGEIVVMVGSVDYKNNQFGRVNVTQRPRQPGSSIKPLIYTAALLGRYNPTTIIEDKPTTFGVDYKPENYNKRHYGKVTVRQALNMSLNVPAVKVLEDIGIPRVINVFSNLGLTTIPSDQYYGLSLALGTTEVRLDELTRAYATLGNQGKRPPLRAILEIKDQSGETVSLPDSYTTSTQTINPEAAFLISDILADTSAEKPVFGRSLVIPGRSVAVKTGTTQSFRDAWTVGYTPQIAVGVWVGNNDNTPMTEGADGSQVAAPIWKSYLINYLKDKPVISFSPPNEVKKLTVDKNTGLLTKFGCGGAPITDYFASWNLPNDSKRMPCTPPPPPEPTPETPVEGSEDELVAITAE